MQSDVQKDVSFGEAFRFWLKPGFISLGRPAGQIVVMNVLYFIALYLLRLMF